MVRKSESFRESAIGGQYRSLRGASILHKNKRNVEEEMRNEYPIVEIVEIFSETRTVV